MALAQRHVARAQLVIALELQLGLEIRDARDLLLEILELLALAYAERSLQNGHIYEGTNGPSGHRWASCGIPETVRGSRAWNSAPLAPPSPTEFRATSLATSTR